MKLSLQVTTAILISSFVSAACGAGVSYYLVQQAREDLQALVQAQARHREKTPEVEVPRGVEMPRPSTVERPGKDEAWATWYQVPEHCGIDVSEADFVGCVNHKMRARKEFERVWQKGMN